MSQLDLRLLAPLWVVALSATVTMLVIAVRRSHAAAALLTILGLACGFASLPWAAPGLPRAVTPLLSMDRYASFFIGLVYASTLVVAILEAAQRPATRTPREELYVLLQVAALGAATLAASTHFASFFLALEILSVSLYALIAYRRESPAPIEAGLKYLVLAGASSAALLFGMALVYYELGTLELGALAANGAASPLATASPVLITGAMLMLTAVGFKLALVPFHMWTPDVYQGASAPVTAFIAAVSKTGMLALLLRFAYVLAPGARPLAAGVLAAIAAASMIGGTFLALQQRSLKRLLAYSSITHLGYALLPLVAGGPLAVPATMYYVTAYVVSVLLCFGVISALTRGDDEPDDLESYRGLLFARPYLATLLATGILSLAGIPLTAGFLAKLYALTAGVAMAQWPLTLTLIITSGIGIYYYLRVLVVMLASPTPASTGIATPALAAAHPSAAAAAPIALGAILGLLLIALVVLGVYPTPLNALITAAAAAVP